GVPRPFAPLPTTSVRPSTALMVAEPAHASRTLRQLRDDRLTSIRAVRSALREAHLPFAETIPALDGSPWTALDQHLVEVERYVEGEAMNSWLRLLFGMRMLGRVHDVLAGMPVSRAGRTSPTANQIDADEALRSARRATSVIRSWGPIRR